MADFKIGRIRFTWQGDWATGTAYTKDDIVRYGGKSYVCLVGHNASADFNTDLDFIDVSTTPDTPAPKWVLWFDGYAWKADWTPATFYALGDIVKYGSNIYRCNDSHTSSTLVLGLEQDQLKWTEYGSSDAWTNEWSADTRYKLNDLVKYGGIIYRCIEGHTSDSGISEVTYDKGTEFVTAKHVVSSAFLEIFHAELTPAPAELLAYYADIAASDIIRLTGTVFNSEGVATTGNSTLIATGAVVIINNLSSTPGAVAPYGITYRVPVSTTASIYGSDYTQLKISVPYTPTLEVDGIKWVLATLSENWLDAWSISTQYRNNDIVRYGGILYRCSQGHTSADNLEDGLELDQNKWNLFHDGIDYKSTWDSDVRYKLNDLVKYGSALWICTDYHTSVTLFEPVNWDLYVPGLEYANQWVFDQQYVPGDVVKWGGYSYYALTHNSNTSPGDHQLDWELLTTGYKVKNEWNSATSYATGDMVRRFGQLYLAILDNQNQQVTNTNFWELLIPGEHWRAEWAVDTEYVIGDVVTYIATAYRCIKANLATNNTSPVNDIFNEFWIVYLEGEPTNRLSTQGDTLYYAADDTERLPLSSVQGQLLQVTDTAPSWETFGQISKVYYVAPNGFNSNDYGHTQDMPWQSVAYACANVTGPATIFIKTGDYEEVLPIVVPADVALVGDELRSTVIKPAAGYEDSNMFLVRNGTGIRNMTLKGLTGTLGEPNQYTTRRPTAGAYVSLDPGNGVNDSSAWITTKSPYVQNVTTFGTGCIGLKIDGDLHAGGNRSVVANDFTQILSDGIGVWVTNGGLSELVSVFSYYGHIGYLAENGGKIRATNGNSSYGSYGCVSEGVSAEETPVSGTVNNRWQEAQVATSFIGEASDRILKLEFSNAGENYTTANYTFTGSGTGIVAIADEFRDQAVFEARVTQGSIFGNSGGNGYTIVSNNIQSGDLYSVTIASNNKNEPEELIGKRLLVSSGTGVGQYGYVHDVSSVSKVTIVCKESFDTFRATQTTAVTNIITVASTSTLYVNMPVAFSPVIVVAEMTATTTGTNKITLSSTTDMWVNQPIIFTGQTFGGIVNGTQYYISSIVGSDITVTTVIGNPNTSLITQTGSATATANGLLGSVHQDTVYFVTATNFTATTFSVSTSISGVPITLSSGTGFMTVNAVGWDHINPGWYIEPTLDTTSVYSIEPRITFDKPAYSTLSGALITPQASVAFGNDVYITVGSGSTSLRSVDGVTWTSSSSLPNSGPWTDIVFANGAFIAISEVSNTAASSIDGLSWSTVSVTSPSIIGAGRTGFIAAQTGTSLAYRTTNNGSSWSSLTLPTSGAWTGIAFGGSTWVIISELTFLYSTDNGDTWSSATIPSAAEWTSVAYGNGRFVAISTADTAAAYSLDGITWITATLPSVRNWTTVSYGQGSFFTVATGGNNGASSADGITWTPRSLSASSTWSKVIHGNPNGNSQWLAISSSGTATRIIKSGARALGRPVVSTGKITSIKLWEPGSGYSGVPAITVVDPEATIDVTTLCRIGNGVLGNPTFTNRGTGYRTSSTVCTVTGDGYADSYQPGKFLYVSDLSRLPGPGANLAIAGLDDIIYKVVTVLDLGNGDAKFQIAPYLKVFNAPVHGTAIEIREQYSQVRLTGHDFLMIGTGNFIDTNYPTINEFNKSQENEVAEFGGGRVFYTSTDQDGNFRVGELFKVEQATGTVSISADFFALQGLEELALGGFSIGGSAVVIREFSTDQFFTADSNNIVPTQKAIKAYIARRISGGGSDAQTGTLVAGIVRVGPQRIDTTTDTQVNVTTKMNIKKGIDGSMLAMTMFADSFSNNINGDFSQ